MLGTTAILYHDHNVAFMKRYMP